MWAGSACEACNLLEAAGAQKLFLTTPTISSSSQAKRVNIGVSIITDPFVLYLDEPVGSPPHRSCQLSPVCSSSKTSIPGAFRLQTLFLPRCCTPPDFALFAGLHSCRSPKLYLS